MKHTKLAFAVIILIIAMHLEAQVQKPVNGDYIVDSLITGSQQNCILFKGDFNNKIIASPTKPFSWDRFGPERPDTSDHRWRLDSEYVRQGNYSLRIELRPGDNARKGSAERAEILGMNDSLGNSLIINEKSGVQYYAFSIRLDSNWQAPFKYSDTTQPHGIFLQLHKKLDDSITARITTGPAFSFQALDRFFVRTNTGNIYNPVKTDYQLLNPNLNKGHWIDFVIKLKYAIDNTGEIMIWRRDDDQLFFTLVLNLNHIQTLLYDTTSSEKLAHVWHTGYYRHGGAQVTNVLWLDGCTLASSAAMAQANAFNSTVVLPGDLSSVPFATPATRLDSNKLNANWKVYQNATGYRLDVSTSPSFSIMQTEKSTEGFKNGIASPTGWTISNNIIANSSIFGGASPSLEFRASNAQVLTKKLKGPATELKFWIKGLNTDNLSSLLVEGFDGNTWTTIAHLTKLSKTGDIKKFDASSTPSLGPHFIQFRFTYVKSAGTLVFDDVSIEYNNPVPVFVKGYNNVLVTNTSQVIKGLGPDTTYYYRVRAVTDSTTTRNSNVIAVTTNKAGLIQETTTAISNSSVSIAKNNGLNVQVFPNPSPDEFVLTTQTNKNEKMEIIVINMQGREIYRATGSSNNKYIFGRTFAPGVYVVRVKQEKNIQTVKVIKGQ